ETHGFGDGCHVNRTLQSVEERSVESVDSSIAARVLASCVSLHCEARGARFSSRELMETRVLPRPGWTLVAIAGRLDMISAGPLEQELETLIGAGTRRLAIDMSGLDYLSSAGLRALLVAGRRLQE